MIRIERALERAFYKRLRFALKSEEGYEIYAEFCRDFYRTVFIDHFSSTYREMISECWADPMRRAKVYLELSREIHDGFH